MTLVSREFISALRDASVIAPELPQADAYETYEAVVEHEATVVLPRGVRRRSFYLQDYAEGSAEKDNDFSEINTDRSELLVTAEHATDPIRGKERGGADHGTGGLTSLLAERTGATALIALGRRTNLAAVGQEQPIKLAMDRLLPTRRGFLSVHGMRSGKFVTTKDTSEIHAIISLGPEPNETSRSIAAALMADAKDMGLRVVIGNDVKHYEYDEKTDDYLRDSATGLPKQRALAAKEPITTTSRAYRLMKQGDFEIPAFQIEMSRLLRIVPEDMEHGWHRDAKSRALGVHLGWLLVERANNYLVTAK